MAERMGGTRGAVILGLLVLLAIAVGKLLPFATEKHQIYAATPSPAAVWAPTPATLAGGSTACLDQVTFVPQGQIAQLLVGQAPKSSPPLTLTLKARGYAQTARIAGGYVAGPVEAHVVPPRQSVIGTFCIHNDGKRKVLLQGSTEGRTVSRPNLTVDGAPVAIKLTLVFLQQKPVSMLGHLGQMIGHASTLKPLPVWVLWPLLVLVLLGIPAGLFYALAAGAQAEPAPVVEPAAPPLPWPRLWPALGRGWRAAYARVARLPARWVLVAGLVVIAIDFFAFALRTHTFQLDENQYVYLARFTWEHLPSSLWNTTVVNRGIQRLEFWMLMLPLALFSSPTSFIIGHAVNVLAFVSAGIPAYLIARGLGLRGGWRLAAALLTLMTPWAVIVTSFLMEPLAYPAFVWSLWAIWRACVTPGPRAEALAIALILVTALSRANMLVLFPLFYLCVLVQELRFGTREARELWRRHWLLPAFVLAVLGAWLLSKAGVLPPTSSVTGYYGNTLQGISSAFLEKNWAYVARIAAGTGLFGAAIGTAWLWRHAIRPADPERHAFAFAALGAILLVLYSNATAGSDERYVIYLAPPLLIAAVVALARRDVGWPLVGIAGVLGAVVIHHVGWNSQGGPFGFFVGPAETFYARVGLLNLQQWRPGSNPATIAFALALIVAGIAAFSMLRRPSAARLRLVLTGGLILIGLTQAQYTLSHFVDEAASASGPGLSAHAWVDKVAYGKAKVGIWAVGEGNTNDYNPVWMDVQFWNNSVHYEVGMDGGVEVQNPPGDDLVFTHADPVTGRLSLVAQPPPQPNPPLPKLLVIPATGREAIVGTELARPSFLPARLIRVSDPPRLRWGFTGAAPDGYLSPGPATIRVFRDGLANRSAGQCLIVDVRSPFGWKGSWQLKTSGFRRRGPIGSDALARVNVPLRRISGGGAAPYQEVELSGIGKPVGLADGRSATVRIAALATGRCG